MAGNTRWTPHELEILTEDYEHSTIEEMVSLLPERTKDAIQWKANSIGLIIRNGKQIAANNKLIINITDQQLAFLQSKRNHSRVVRDAIDQLIKQR
jgi:hypothetical protein